ncbi:MAG: hypothetical protein KAR20_22640, partial [Candidatus Heimdallarchaeota archaeon]|nr:hypothetical protein [Candidatus Heimdallarchaeota archaeon]
MTDIDNNSNKKYSPWMNNWKDNVENPKKLQNPQTAKTIKLLLWIGFFTILVSPIAIIVISTLITNEGIKEYKPTPFTKADAIRFMEETEAAIHFGEYEKAIQIADYVITENADIPRIYILAGAANFYLMDYQEAIEFANEALKLNPNFSAAKYLLAMCLYEIGSKVGENYADVNIQPNNYPYSYYFGVLYKELIGDYKSMLFFAQKGVDSDDKSPLLLYSLSRALYANAEYNKALKVIEMIKDKGDFIQFSTKAIWRNAEILKAEILLILNEIDDAEMILNRNFESYPNWWHLIRVYAKLLIAQENYEKTVQILERYKFPKN